MRGVVVDLIGGADLLDDTLVEHGNAVGQGQGLLLIVGDVDGGDTEVLLHLLQLIAQLDAELGVQIGQRLVHTDDGGVRHQCAGDGHALLLAAGQLGHSLLQLLVAQVHLAGDVPHTLVDLCLFRLLDLQAEGDIVVDGHGGEQGVALEHDADVAVFDGDVGDVPILHHHGALHRIDEAGDGAQGGGLAAAGRAKEREEFTLLHMDVDAVQGGEVAELHHDIIQPDHNTQNSFVRFVSHLYGYCTRLLHSCKGGKRIFRPYSCGEPESGSPQELMENAYSAAFWVRVAQSRLSQSGSATAALLSAQ